MLMDIKFSLDNLTHVVAIALGDKAKVVSTCPSCNGTGRDKTNEEGWKIGARYEGIKPCAVCKGEGRL
jgi:DnaJ-class molecular chaperone